mgnify:FL=1
MTSSTQKPTPTKEDILSALSRVTDKDLGKDVVSAGIIQGVVLREGHVGFSIEVDPAKGAEKEPLRKACEEAVRAIPGILSVTAVLTAHSDTPSAPQQGAHAGHSHGRPGGAQGEQQAGRLEIPA